MKVFIVLIINWSSFQFLAQLDELITYAGKVLSVRMYLHVNRGGTNQPLHADVL